MIIVYMLPISPNEFADIFLIIFFFVSLSVDILTTSGIPLSYCLLAYHCLYVGLVSYQKQCEGKYLHNSCFNGYVLSYFPISGNGFCEKDAEYFKEMLDVSIV